MFGAASLLEFCIFIVVIICALFYTSVLILLIRHRNVEPFDKPFFGLFLSLGYADLGHAITSYCFTITKAWAWVDWSWAYYHPVFGWWARACSGLCGWYFGWSQYLGVTAMAVNRHATIAWNGQVWNERRQRNWLIVQWIVPFIVIIPLFTQPYQVVTVETNNFTYLYASPPPSFYVVYVSTTALLGSLVVFFVAVVYGVIFVKLRKMMREFQDQSGIDSAEIKFLIVGFVLFIMMGMIQCFMFGFSAATAMGNLEAKAFLSKLIYILFSLYSFSNPFLLLAASDATRDKFRENFHTVLHITNANAVQRLN